MRTFIWVGGGLGLTFLGVAFWLSQQFPGRDDKRHTAIAQAHLFLKACVSYRHFSGSDGKLPATLTDLVDPDPRSGRKPLVDGGKVALLDPWEQPFRYVVLQTEAGTEAFVWAEREDKGKLSISGAKLSADGRIRTFNRPTD